MTASGASQTGPQTRHSSGKQRLLALAGVGAISGLMSGLFGVGGGIVTVPLLVLWLGYGSRVATGTSLAAIIVTAAIGAFTQHSYGNVDFGKALLVGVPAVLGVVLGTWIQQRVDTRTIGLVFSVVLALVAIKLMVS